MKEKFCKHCGARLKEAMFGEGAIRVINELKEEGIIKDFVIGGGVAATAHVEPITTNDLDIILETITTGIAFLQPVFDSLREKGYDFEEMLNEEGGIRRGEHIVIEGTRTQFMPVTSPLLEEASKNPVIKSVNGINVKVLSAEYLVAIYLSIQRPKDKRKLIALLEQAEINEKLLNEILQKYNLVEKYERFVEFTFEELK